MKIYLDNAATTPLDREVFGAMEPYLFQYYANPSSAHKQGREVKQAIEQARNTIADLLNTSAESIFFTSGGTEADNTAILSAIRSEKIRLAITTPFEHHAVLNTLKSLEKSGEIQLVYLKHDEKGNLSLPHLESLLSLNKKSFVSVMHGNNEVGNLNPIEQIAEICNRYGAIFHTDTVQTMGHYAYDLKELKADFIVGSAHKFHGPKGTGFLYRRKGNEVIPILYGGSQENKGRAGTENVAGIIGLAKALEISYRDLAADKTLISQLKSRLIGRLKTQIPGIEFNGNSVKLKESLYTVLSVSLPPLSLGIDALSVLDQQNICASGGSACSSHSKNGSHVLHALGHDARRNVIRFSFSRFNTESEIDYAADCLATCCRQNQGHLITQSY